KGAFIKLKKFFISPNFTRLLSKEFHVPMNLLKKKIIGVEHHVAHAAVAFYSSHFKSSAILSIDGSGEVATTLLGKFQGNKFTKLKQVFFPHSVGLLYSTITQFLGFRIDNGEGKVMGLAPYGEPVYKDIFDKMIWPTKNGKFKMNMSYFRYHFTGEKKTPFYSKKIVRLFGKPRIKESEITRRDQNLAATLQDSTEKIGIHLARHLWDLTREKNLCISGGVALNSVMNFKIKQNTRFKNIYIYPASSDAGCAIGSAYYLYYNLMNNAVQKVTQSPYLGPAYSDEQIEEACKKFKLKYTVQKDPDRLTQFAAEKIKQGKILGWFQGRMEVGPRALGNRSIICAPFPGKMKDILNDRVKHREGFRPFAPSAKTEGYKKYFDIDTPSPYMLLVCDVKKEKLDQVAAITHVDNTARLQTVSKEENPLYWKLIDKYEKISGIPVILNTSFNVRGEPIVSSPEDAIKCFLGTHMDYLIMGHHIVKK
ncbi:MAG: hypothetical protein JW827_07540, partial [Spirochaetes bacterium]|nr:hypothetical protein [Spirochaetota bacterium]